MIDGTGLLPFEDCPGPGPSRSLSASLNVSVPNFNVPECDRKPFVFV